MTTPTDTTAAFQTLTATEIIHGQERAAWHVWLASACHATGHSLADHRWVGEQNLAFDRWWRGVEESRR